MEGIKRKCYKCENCFQSFFEFSRLEHHQKKKKVQCFHCKQKFCSLESLEKHHHSIVKPVTELTDLFFWSKGFDGNEFPAYNISYEMGHRRNSKKFSSNCCDIAVNGN